MLSTADCLVSCYLIFEMTEEWPKFYDRRVRNLILIEGGWHTRKDKKRGKTKKGRATKLKENR